MDAEFLSVKETAAIFSVHPNTIYAAVKKGYLIAIRVGIGKRSPYRISKKEIEAIHQAVIRDLAVKGKENG